MRDLGSESGVEFLRGADALLVDGDDEVAGFEVALGRATWEHLDHFEGVGEQLALVVFEDGGSDGEEGREVCPCLVVHADADAEGADGH